MPEEIQTTPNQTDNPAAGQSTATTNDNPATFTQADVDRIVSERLKRSKNDAAAIEADLLKKLGVDSIDTAKSKIAKVAAGEQAQQTELEKVQNALAAAEKKAADADTARLKLESERKLEKRDTALKAALRDAKAIAPDDVLIIMQAKFPDLVTATMNEAGEIDTKAVGELVTKAKAERKQDFRSSNPGVPGVGSGGQNPGQDDDKSARDAHWREYRRY